jgi:hypothetical protein
MAKDSGASRARAIGITADLLPARHGDCIALQWSDGGSRHYGVIDAGPAHAYEDISRRLRALGLKELDLLVMTHVDADHIEGVILLVRDKSLGLSLRDVWYNGADQLIDLFGPFETTSEAKQRTALDSDLSPVQGEILSMVVGRRQLPSNQDFRGASVMTAEAGPLRQITLPGGLVVTVLAPGEKDLAELHRVWRQACAEAGLVGDDPDRALAAMAARPKLSPLDSYLDRGQKLSVPKVQRLAQAAETFDTSVTNASSIVLLAELGQERMLLAGDSTPAVLLPAVQRLIAERNLESLPLTHFKLPHHGSSKNLSPALVRLLPAERYLISSDGSYFGHPDDEAIATVLEYGPPGLELVFNYDNPRNRRWADDKLTMHYGHRVSFLPPIA